MEVLIARLTLKLGEPSVGQPADPRARRLRPPPTWHLPHHPNARRPVKPPHPTLPSPTNQNLCVDVLARSIGSSSISTRQTHLVEYKGGPQPAWDTLGITRSSPSPSGSAKQLLPWLVAVAFFMESLDTTILNTAVPVVSRGARGRSAQHEVGAGQLHVEPRRLHSDQRLDGRPLRNAPGVCLRDRPLHPRVLSLRHLERHPSARRLPHPAGLRRSHDGAGRPAHPGAHLRQIRAHPRHELRRHSRL